ncbi:MAG: Uma2 family endonuclease [Cyanobacteriota bacterium]|nr:Uma2 family endonuclease [Cyanobacteriota bacterium]
MTIAIHTSKNLSLDEFLALPETKPASEYINGKVYQKPMPQGKHSTLQFELSSAINRVGKPEKLVYAFPELRCTFGGRSIVPDIAVFEWKCIPLDEEGEIANRIEIDPDWTIEILSPDQNPTRVIDNILFCLDRQTKLGWFLDPQERSIITFRPQQQPVVKRADDRLPVLDVLQDWQVCVNDVFAWLSFT